MIITIAHIIMCIPNNNRDPKIMIMIIKSTVSSIEMKSNKISKNEYKISKK